MIMKLNSFSPLPEDDEELHLPELVYWASLGDVEQVEQLYRDWETDRKSTRLNSSHITRARMPSSA